MTQIEFQVVIQMEIQGLDRLTSSQSISSDLLTFATGLNVYTVLRTHFTCPVNIGVGVIHIRRTGKLCPHLPIDTHEASTYLGLHSNG